MSEMNHIDSAMDKNYSSERKVKRIGRKNFFAILILGTAGQIAWVMENSNFNTFVYDEITQDPAPVAWMVAISAITATITTIFMGIKSDRVKHRWGKRKPYIFYGYILWGIITILFPLVSWISWVGLAVVMVVLMDAIMTFFGSTANDAAFNAWIADISHSSNRNRIQTLNSLSGFIAIAITYGTAGVVIDKYGYTLFFFLFGGIISIVGLISGFLVIEEPHDISSTNREEIDENEAPPSSQLSLSSLSSSYLASDMEKTIWAELKDLFNPKILKENRNLFLLFSYMAISGIASQIYMPYLFQYLEHYLGLSKTEYSGYIIYLMPILIIAVIIIGWISHRFNRKSILIVVTISGAAITISMALLSPYLRDNVDSIGIVAVLLYVLGQIPTMAAMIAHGGWLLDSYPEGDVGKFQGVRMLFMVAIPMVIGPPIGAYLIQNYGIPFGDGFIPAPEIFFLGGIVSLFAIIPILFIKKDAGKIHFAK